MIRVNLENQIIEQRICYELDQMQIQYTIKRNHDSVYNGIYEMTEGYGFLEINESDQNIVEEILDNLKFDNPSEELPNKRKKLNSDWLIFISIIIALIVIICILGVNLYTINRKYSLTTSTNKYYHVWSEDGKQYISKKMNGKVDHISFDSNYNGFFEKIVYYDENGIIESVTFSKNDDGNYDHHVHYNKDGSIGEENFSDDKGVIIKSIVNYGNNKTITWQSSNNDRVQDKMHINNNGKEKDISIFDIIKMVK